MPRTAKKTTARKATAKKAITRKKRSSKKPDQKFFKTPSGILSFPYLVKPHTKENYPNGKYHSGSYSVDFHVDKEKMQTEVGEALYQACVDVWNAKFKDDQVDSVWDIPSAPFKDMDEDGGDVDDRLKGTIRIRAKSKFQPTVVGPTGLNLSSEELDSVKGGDIAKLSLSAYAWDMQDGGVSFNLDAVKHLAPGEALGGGGEAVNILAEDDEEIDLPEEADEETEEESEDDIDFDDDDE